VSGADGTTERRVSAFRLLAEGFRSPDEAWRARYAALSGRAAAEGIAAPVPPGVEMGREHFRLFGPAPACPLELTFHLAENPFEQARLMAHMSGFYRAFGVEPEPGERPDNLSVAVSFLGLLALKERNAVAKGLEEAREVTAAAVVDFTRDFVAPGVEAFTGKLVTVSPPPFYTALAELLRREVYAIHAPVAPFASHWGAPPDEAPEEEVTCGLLKQPSASS
jgi:nitrate reductase assembly molybdenum cofactor insertion protein NarJ